MKSLDVYLHGNLAGQLNQNQNGKLEFQYCESYARSAIPLSLSMPVSDCKYDDQVVRPFFAGLLPEEDQLQLVARNLKVSARNPFSLLKEIGRDCAGAIELYSSNEKPVALADQKRVLIDQNDLAQVLQALPSNPLLVGSNRDVRISLAGAQSKIAVVVKAGAIYLGTNVPSTHIVKPSISALSVQDSVFNEFFCMRLARLCGLVVPNADIGFALNVPYYLVERYDRNQDDTEVRCIHQEDFCQALSIMPEQKYEREGGPTVKKCIDLIEIKSKQPAVDRQRFIEALVFNYLIGNADAHGKNFSLLHQLGGTRLAPLYDLFSTAVYDNLSLSMAMKIGSRYKPNEVRLKDWHSVVADTSTAKNLMGKTLRTFATKVSSCAENLERQLVGTPHGSAIQAEICAVIKSRARHIEDSLCTG